MKNSNPGTVLNIQNNSSIITDGTQQLRGMLPTIQTMEQGFSALNGGHVNEQTMRQAFSTPQQNTIGLVQTQMPVNGRIIIEPNPNGTVHHLPQTVRNTFTPQVPAYEDLYGTYRNNNNNSCRSALTANQTRENGGNHYLVNNGNTLLLNQPVQRRTSQTPAPPLRQQNSQQQPNGNQPQHQIDLLRDQVTDLIGLKQLQGNVSQQIVTKTHPAQMRAPPSSSSLMGHFRIPLMKLTSGKKVPLASKRTPAAPLPSPASAPNKSQIPASPTVPGIPPDFWDYINSPAAPRVDDEEEDRDDNPFWVCDPETWQAEQEKQRRSLYQRSATVLDPPGSSGISSVRTPADGTVTMVSRAGPQQSTAYVGRNVVSKRVVYNADDDVTSVTTICSGAKISATCSSGPYQSTPICGASAGSSEPVQEYVSVTGNTLASPTSMALGAAPEPNASEDDDFAMPKIISCYSLNPQTDDSKAGPSTSEDGRTREEREKMKKKLGCNKKVPLVKVIPVPQAKRKKKGGNIKTLMSDESLARTIAKTKVMLGWNEDGQTYRSCASEEQADSRPHSTSPQTTSPLLNEQQGERSRHVSTEIYKTSTKKQKTKSKSKTPKSSRSRRKTTETSPLADWINSTRVSFPNMHVVNAQTGDISPMGDNITARPRASYTVGAPAAKCPVITTLKITGLSKNKPIVARFPVNVGTPESEQYVSAVIVPSPPAPTKVHGSNSVERSSNQSSSTLSTPSLPSSALSGKSVAPSQPEPCYNPLTRSNSSKKHFPRRSRAASHDSPLRQALGSPISLHGNSNPAIQTSVPSHLPQSQGSKCASAPSYVSVISTVAVQDEPLDCTKLKTKPNLSKVMAKADDQVQEMPLNLKCPLPDTPLDYSMKTLRQKEKEEGYRASKGSEKTQKQQESTTPQHTDSLPSSEESSSQELPLSLVTTPHLLGELSETELCSSTQSITTEESSDFPFERAPSSQIDSSEEHLSSDTATIETDASQDDDEAMVESLERVINVAVSEGTLQDKETSVPTPFSGAEMVANLPDTFNLQTLCCVALSTHIENTAPSPAEYKGIPDRAAVIVANKPSATSALGGTNASALPSVSAHTPPDVTSAPTPPCATVVPTLPSATDVPTDSIATGVSTLQCDTTVTTVSCSGAQGSEVSVATVVQEGEIIEPSAPQEPELVLYGPLPKPNFRISSVASAGSYSDISDSDNDDRQHKKAKPGKSKLALSHGADSPAIPATEPTPKSSPQTDDGSALLSEAEGSPSKEQMISILLVRDLEKNENASGDAGDEDTVAKPAEKPAAVGDTVRAKALSSLSTVPTIKLVTTTCSKTLPLGEPKNLTLCIPLTPERVRKIKEMKNKETKTGPQTLSEEPPKMLEDDRTCDTTKPEENQASGETAESDGYRATTITEAESDVPMIEIFETDISISPDRKRERSPETIFNDMAEDFPIQHGFISATVDENVPIQHGVGSAAMAEDWAIIPQEQLTENSVLGSLKMNHLSFDQNYSDDSECPLVIDESQSPSQDTPRRKRKKRRLAPHYDQSMLQKSDESGQEPSVKTAEAGRSPKLKSSCVEDDRKTEEHGTEDIRNIDMNVADAEKETTENKSEENQIEGQPEQEKILHSTPESNASEGLSDREKMLDHDPLTGRPLKDSVPALDALKGQPDPDETKKLEVPKDVELEDDCSTAANPSGKLDDPMREKQVPVNGSGKEQPAMKEKERPGLGLTEQALIGAKECLTEVRQIDRLLQEKNSRSATPNFETTVSICRLNSTEMQDNLSIISNNTVINIRPESLDVVIEAKKKRKAKADKFLTLGDATANISESDSLANKENLGRILDIVTEKTPAPIESDKKEAVVPDKPVSDIEEGEKDTQKETDEAVSSQNSSISNDDLDVVKTIPHKNVQLESPVLDSPNILEECCGEYDNMYLQGGLNDSVNSQKASRDEDSLESDTKPDSDVEAQQTNARPTNTQEGVSVVTENQSPAVAENVENMLDVSVQKVLEDEADTSKADPNCGSKARPHDNAVRRERMVSKDSESSFFSDYVKIKKERLSVDSDSTSRKKTPRKLGYNTHASLESSDIKIKRRRLVKKSDGTAEKKAKSPKISPKKVSYILLSDSSDSSDETDMVPAKPSACNTPRPTPSPLKEQTPLNVKLEPRDDSAAMCLGSTMPFALPARDDPPPKTPAEKLTTPVQSPCSLSNTNNSNNFVFDMASDAPLVTPTGVTPVSKPDILKKLAKVVHLVTAPPETRFEDSASLSLPDRGVYTPPQNSSEESEVAAPIILKLKTFSKAVAKEAGEDGERKKKKGKGLKRKNSNGTDPIHKKWIVESSTTSEETDSAGHSGGARKGVKKIRIQSSIFGKKKSKGLMKRSKKESGLHFHHRKKHWKKHPLAESLESVNEPLLPDEIEKKTKKREIEKDVNDPEKVQPKYQKEERRSSDQEDSLKALVDEIIAASPTKGVRKPLVVEPDPGGNCSSPGFPTVQPLMDRRSPSPQLTKTPPQKRITKPLRLESTFSDVCNKTARMGKWEKKKIPPVPKHPAPFMPHFKPERISKAAMEESIYLTMQKLLNGALILDQRPNRLYQQNNWAYDWTTDVKPEPQKLKPPSPPPVRRFASSGTTMTNYGKVIWFCREKVHLKPCFVKVTKTRVKSKTVKIHRCR